MVRETGVGDALPFWVCSCSSRTGADITDSKPLDWGEVVSACIIASYASRIEISAIDRNPNRDMIFGGVLVKGFSNKANEWSKVPTRSYQPTGSALLRPGSEQGTNSVLLARRLSNKYSEFVDAENLNSEKAVDIISKDY